jgi:hypothetical protein
MTGGVKVTVGVVTDLTSQEGPETHGKQALFAVASRSVRQHRRLGRMGTRWIDEG